MSDQRIIEWNDEFPEVKRDEEKEEKGTHEASTNGCWGCDYCEFTYGASDSSGYLRGGNIICRACYVAGRHLEVTESDISHSLTSHHAGTV